MTRIIQLDYANYLQCLGVTQNEIDVLAINPVQSRGSRTIGKTLLRFDDVS